MIKTIALGIIIALIFFLRLALSYNYDSDFGRDIVDISKVATGDITLLGPKLSFGGIHAGPYYYYLFTPAIFFFKNYPESMLFLNAAIFLLTFIIVRPYIGFPKALYLATIPLTIYSARGPGNAFSYIPLLITELLLLPYVIKQKKPILWLIYGFVAGVTINFHLINVVIFGCLFGSGIIYFIIKKDKKNILNILLAGIGIVIAFAPFFLFEFTHNFVQIRNTFIDQSYKAFTDNTNLSNPLATSTNPFINFWLLTKYFSEWSGLPFIVLFLTNIILFIKTKEKQSHQIMLFSTSILSLIILAFIARSQLAFHYFFPFITITLISTLSFFKNNRLTFLILLILIIGNIYYFPKRLYLPSLRNISEYRSFTNSLISSTLFKKVNTSSFNIYCARETTVAPLGWEYRHFLNINGLFPNIPTEFSKSQNLIIIQESTNHETIDTLRSWEIDQFGPKKLIDKISLGTRTVYLYSTTSSHE